eukprot:76319-Chlamydomonas_euryale.AAC.1
MGAGRLGGDPHGGRQAGWRSAWGRAGWVTIRMGAGRLGGACVKCDAALLHLLFRGRWYGRCGQWVVLMRRARARQGIS